MKWKDLEDDSLWLNPMKQSWHSYLDQLCQEKEWINCDELKDFVDEKLDKIKEVFQTYKSTLSVTPLKNVMLTLYVYCTLKNMTIVGENNPPTVPMLLPPDDDLRKKYSYWTYELPVFDDTIEWFEFEQDPESVPPELKGVPSTTDKYDEYIDEISELVAVDEAAIGGIGTILQGKALPFVLHLTYVQPKTVAPQQHPRDYILNTMKVQEILNTFSWEIPEIYPM